MAFRTHQGNDSRPRSSDTHHRGDDSPSDRRRSRFQVQQLATSEAVVRIRRNSNLQLPKQRLATSLRKRPFVRQGDVVAYRRRFCEAGRWLAPRSVLPVCAPGRWFAACWQLLHPPSKIENRRLLIKKTAKRYEHSAGLRVESSERQNESGGWPQAKGGPKRETDTNANRLGVPDAPKTQPKALAPNRPRRSAIPRQKMPLGGLAAAFSSLAGRKHDYGASRNASKRQERPEKERRSAKNGRKAANGAPNATLKPCSEAPWRRFLPSCEQNRATAASPQRKNLLNATSI